jgi:alpha-L-fucosidase
MNARLLPAALLGLVLGAPPVGRAADPQTKGAADTIEASDEKSAGRVEVAPLTPGPFQPTWDSLAAYEAPAWFRDAKFGIFMHWGLPAVPDETRPFGTGHYARGLYRQHGRGAPPHCKDIYDWHVGRYGHPSQFGYKDFIPLWRAERFDADALVAFYRRIGARYIVPVAVHHDNYDIYDSSHTRWDVMETGPRRDILGEWKRAAERHGLRFGASSHLDRAPAFLEASHGADTDGPMAGVPYDGADDRHADFYLKGVTPEQWQVQWYRRTREIVTKYEPDLLYFDGALPFGDYGLHIAAELYNRSVARHGRNEAVLNLKRGPNPKAFVLDIERGQSDRLLGFPWQTDTTLISGWFYHRAELEMTTPVVIANLADIVSKNGNLLLNIGLRPDGTIPDNQRETLEGVGRWLELNGEAIYGTRPWKTFGEGPTQVKSGHFNEPKSPFTARDVRFTTKGDTLYAIVLGWPGAGAETVIAALAAGETARPIRRVELVASGASLAFRQEADGLRVTFPAAPAGEHAFVLRLTP